MCVCVCDTRVNFLCVKLFCVCEDKKLGGVMREYFLIHHTKTFVKRHTQATHIIIYIHTYIIKYGRQRHHRERIHERHAGGEKSERGVGALGGHFFRLGRVYASVRRVDGDLGILII